MLQFRKEGGLARAALARFGRGEDGSLLIFTLFILVAMFLAIGTGLDTARTELQRVKLQNCADRAVLAAADLEQDLDAEAVVRDYFERCGMDPDQVTVTVSEQTGSKVVTAETRIDVPTIVLDLVGFDSLPAPALGTAEESVTDVEISLILDNSGSMGWDGNYRLNLLKPAAEQFVDTVIKEDGAGIVSVSLVPFATQVNAGPALLSQFNAGAEHGYSDCVTFAGADFESAALSPAQPLTRTGHFDPFTYDVPVDTAGVVCPFEASRHIRPWSTDADALKAQIDAMWAGGNTSIDVASKWGAALLDPAARPALSGLVAAGTVDDKLNGQPFDYDRANTMKVLVIMSDGQNTAQYRLKAPYREGLSPVWRDPVTGSFSYFVETSGQYYDVAGGALLTDPVGGAAAANLTWPEVFDAMSVRSFARYVKAPAIGGDWTSYYYQIVGTVGAGAKNTRASQICAAARAQGVIVFTVGMDTYGQGDATLADCASSPAHFFDVSAEQIGEAFSSIARQINQLRLTQ